MATPLLTTKLYIPPTRPEPSTSPSASPLDSARDELRAGLRTSLVPRPRLIQRLEEGLRLGHRLTLVSALASRTEGWIALDNERRWYRYHRLFADLLRKRLLGSCCSWLFWSALA